MAKRIVRRAALYSMVCSRCGAIRYGWPATERPYHECYSTLTGKRSWRKIDAVRIGTRVFYDDGTTEDV